VYISDFAIKRPIITVVSMIALVVFGLASLFRLGTDEFPELTPPVVFVAVPYPGAAPDVVEREVVTRIEDKLSSISGVDRMNSTSTDGFGQVVVQFVFSKDIDQAMQDVRDAMSAVRPQLPQEILEPVMNRFDPTQLPIVSLALTSRTLSTPQLTQLADQTIGGELRSIAGVAQVTIVGGDSAQLNINVRPSDLAAAGVGIDQVVNTIRAQNLAAPVGRVNAALENRVIRLDGRLGAPSDFADIVVAQRTGQLVRLGQLADVEAGAAEPTSAALFNGVPAIGLDIIKSREASTTGVGDAVRARVAELQATLPAGVSIEFVRDGGARVRRSVSNVQETLFEGALLTVLVVFLFLNSWRSTVITGLALPVSVLAAFVAVWASASRSTRCRCSGCRSPSASSSTTPSSCARTSCDTSRWGRTTTRRRTKGPTRSGSRWRRRPSPSSRSSSRSASCRGWPGSLQAVRPDDRLRGARLALRLVLARPDAVGLLARSAARGARASQAGHRSPARWTVQRLVRPDRRASATRASSRGRSTTARRRWPSASPRSSSRWCSRSGCRWTFVGVSFFPTVTDNSEFNVSVETPPGSTWSTRGSRPRRSRATIARSTRAWCCTYTTVGARRQSGGRRRRRRIYVRMVPKESDISQLEASGGDPPRDQHGVGGGAYIAVFGRLGFGNQKQIQLEMQGPDAQQLPRSPSESPRCASSPARSTSGSRPGGRSRSSTIALDRGTGRSLGVTVGQVAQALRPPSPGSTRGLGGSVGRSRATCACAWRRLRRRAPPTSRSSRSCCRCSGPNGGAADHVPLGQVAKTVTAGMARRDQPPGPATRGERWSANVLGASMGKAADAMRGWRSHPASVPHQRSRGARSRAERESSARSSPRSASA
jgi:HAE1 family hydrophobic/amphiphilic exporter-1